LWLVGPSLAPFGGVSIITLLGFVVWNPFPKEIGGVKIPFFLPFWGEFFSPYKFLKGVF